MSSTIQKINIATLEITRDVYLFVHLLYTHHSHNMIRRSRGKRKEEKGKPTNQKHMHKEPITALTLVIGATTNYIKIKHELESNLNIVVLNTVMTQTYKKYYWLKQDTTNYVKN